MRRLAAIDVGSNTVHLVVAEVVEGGPPRLRDVRREVTMPRLGHLVQSTGAVGAAARAALAGDLRRLATIAREAGAGALLLGATEAVRRAADREEVLATATAAAGVPCRLIGEEQEARLAFRGATGAHPGPGVTLVTDVGGASTECVLGADGRIESLASVPVGSGMATDTWLEHDPPLATELDACAAGVRSALAAAPAGRPERGIATGGAATTLPRLLDGGDPGDLDAAGLRRCRELCAARPSAELARDRGIDAPRARVLAGGVEILSAVLERYRLERLTVSLAGLREGMILAHLECGDAWVEG